MAFSRFLYYDIGYTARRSRDGWQRLLPYKHYKCYNVTIILILARFYKDSCALVYDCRTEWYGKSKKVVKFVAKAKIIAVANQKDGVGKTTTSVNLAACLAAKEKKVLLVDCDPQGNASSGYGIDKSALATTIYQVIINGAAVQDAIIKTEFGVDVLPANIELAGAEVELVAAISRETRLKRALEPVEQDYDYILIDCPPSLGLLTLNSLAAADSVLMPIQCEFYALEGVSQLMNTIELVRTNLNPHLEVEGVLMTMYDGRTRLAEQVVAEVRENFGELVYKTMIPRTVRLSEAPSYGEPILYYDKRSKGTDTYMKLAEEVMAHGE